MRGVEIRALECCALGLLAEELQQSGVGLYVKIEAPTECILEPFPKEWGCGSAQLGWVSNRFRFMPKLSLAEYPALLAVCIVC